MNYSICDRRVERCALEEAEAARERVVRRRRERWRLARLSFGILFGVVGPLLSALGIFGKGPDLTKEESWRIRWNGQAYRLEMRSQGRWFSRWVPVDTNATFTVAEQEKFFFIEKLRSKQEEREHQAKLSRWVVVKEDPNPYDYRVVFGTPTAKPPTKEEEETNAVWYSSTVGGSSNGWVWVIGQAATMTNVVYLTNSGLSVSFTYTNLSGLTNSFGP